MHKTGIFVLNPTAFSEKDLGKDTVIYLKLMKELSDSRWTAFYSAIKVTTEIINDLRTLPKSNLQPLQDSTESYHIRDSDPVDPSNDVYLDFE